MCADRRRLGVLGGTFDPVHLGHIASAKEIAEAFGLERVLLVLSARPPHKPEGEAAPAADRWRMLELACDEAKNDPAPRQRADREDIAGRDEPVRRAAPVLEPCDVEMRRDAPSWTVDTLGEIAALHPDEELFFILGADAYAEIDTWSRPRELLELANIIVTTRPGWSDVHVVGECVHPPVAARDDARYDPSIGVFVHTSGHKIHGHRIRGIEVSSSEIRSRVRAGLPVEHLTGNAVSRYIHDHGLYAAGRTPAPAGSSPHATRGAGKD